MSRIVYISGKYLPHRAATVHVEDRGYQFADGVYEVIAVSDRCLIDEQPHLERLSRSLAALQIEPPVSDRVLSQILRRMVALNRLRNGILYLQISRGVSRRAHEFPASAQPQLVVTAKRLAPVPTQLLQHGVSVVTIPDHRWARRDLKTISLLPNILGKQEAKKRGAYEAWQVESDGTVTEGTSSNAWIITHGNAVLTHPATERILHGVTRLRIIEALNNEEAQALGVTLVERPFTVVEALGAKEAFISSTTSLVLSVTVIDWKKIGDGTPGPVAVMLRRALERRVADQTRKVA